MAIDVTPPCPAILDEQPAINVTCNVCQLHTKHDHNTSLSGLHLKITYRKNLAVFANCATSTQQLLTQTEYTDRLFLVHPESNNVTSTNVFNNLG